MNVGDTVTWTNRGSEPHTATANNDSFDTGTLNRGESGSATFRRAGSIAYICTIHPSMKGTVRVASSGSGGGSAGASGDSGSGGSGDSGDDDSGSGGGSGDDSGSGDEGSLPATGAEPARILLIGAGMLALGFGLRRRLARA